jgi:anti-sigma regulatory factor (Ser/Thr protein kinase)
MNQSTTVWSHHTELPARATSASQARDFVRHLLVEHGMPSLVDDVELVTSELATNALVHARTHFKVTLAACSESVLLQVEDGSQPAPIRVAAAPHDTSGRGVTIVELLSSDWGVTPGPEACKSVWAAFHTP